MCYSMLSSAWLWQLTVAHFINCNCKLQNILYLFIYYYYYYYVNFASEDYRWSNLLVLTDSAVVLVLDKVISLSGTYVKL